MPDHEGAVKVASFLWRLSASLLKPSVFSHWVPRFLGPSSAARLACSPFSFRNRQRPLVPLSPRQRLSCRWFNAVAHLLENGFLCHTALSHRRRGCSYSRSGRTVRFVTRSVDWLTCTFCRSQDRASSATLPGSM